MTPCLPFNDTNHRVIADAVFFGQRIPRHSAPEIGTYFSNEIIRQLCVVVLLAFFGNEASSVSGFDKIFRIRSRIKVIGIAACGTIATMESATPSNIPILSHARNSRSIISSSVETDASVSSPIHTAYPRPTLSERFIIGMNRTVFIYVRPKTRFKGFWYIDFNQRKAENRFSFDHRNSMVEVRATQLLSTTERSLHIADKETEVNT